MVTEDADHYNGSGKDNADVVAIQAALDALSKNGALLYHPDTKFFRDFLHDFYKLDVPPDPTTAEIDTLRKAMGTLRSHPELRLEFKTEVRELKLAAASLDNAAVGEEASEADGDAVSDFSADSEGDLPEEKKGTGTVPPGVQLLQPETRDPPPAPLLEGELNDDQMERRQQMIADAAAAKDNGDFDKVVQTLTEALSMGGATAALIARRADALLRLRRPVAAIADCDQALSLNPNNARALSIRGRAYASLEEWEFATRDLQLAQSIDFDDDLDALATAIGKHWTAVRAARNARESRRAARKCRNAGRAARHQMSGKGGATGGGGFEGPNVDAAGMPKMPQMPAGFNMKDLLGKVMGNPKLMEAMKNPKVMQAMTEAMSNPASLTKYMNDPEIMEAMKGIMGAMV